MEKPALKEYHHVEGKEAVTAHIRIMKEDEAQEQVVEDYAYLSRSYSTLVGSEVTPPNVYRTHSIVPAYFCLFTVTNWVLTNDGRFDRPESQQGPVSEFLVNFAEALDSSCYY